MAWSRMGSGEATSPRRARSRRIGRLFIAALLLGGSMMGAPVRAGANPLVCVTVYYTILGGPRNYVADDECFVPTGWGELAGEGPDCGPLPTVVAVCYEVSFAGP